MRTILLTPILLFVLLSCDNKASTSNKDLDSTAVESILQDKTSLVDNKLLGQWTVHLSCDGTIMCNVCPKISFRADGFGSTTNGVGIVQTLKWEMEKDRLRILNLTSHDIVDSGEYTMTYRTDKDILELELIDVTNSACYQFTRVTSN
jgi:hypothetical protein